MLLFGCVGLWCFVMVSMVVLILGLLWWCPWWFWVVMLVVTVLVFGGDARGVWCLFLVRINGRFCGG